MSKMDFIVYKGEQYDVTTFQHAHPGGATLIKNFINKDVTDILNKKHKHSQNAMRILENFKVNGDRKMMPVLDNDKMLHFKTFDIDTNKGLAHQICNLNQKQYNELVDTPNIFPYSCKMFDNYLQEEYGAKSSWQSVLVFWSIMIIGKILWVLNSQNEDYLNEGLFSPYVNRQSEKFNLLVVIFVIFLGYFYWTFLEYMIHSFVFHCENYLPDNRFLRTFHFIMHGYHHLCPTDKSKLVFPIFASMHLYPLMRKLIFIDGYGGELFQAGAILGYLAYDMTHYYIHHIEASQKYYQDLKTIHNYHHYVNQNVGLQISSQFWDIVFGTNYVK